MVEESSSQLSDHRKSVERWRDAEPGNTRTDGSPTKTPSYMYLSQVSYTLGPVAMFM